MEKSSKQSEKMCEKVKKNLEKVGLDGLREAHLAYSCAQLRDRLEACFNHAGGESPAHCDPAGGSAGSLFFLKEIL